MKHCTPSALFGLFLAGGLTLNAQNLHPEFQHAMSNLDAANKILLATHKTSAAADIDSTNKEIVAAYNELRTASRDDDKNLAQRFPPAYESGNAGPLHKARHLVEEAQKDASQIEDDAAAKAIQKQALAHMAQAIQHLDAAIAAPGDATYAGGASATSTGGKQSGSDASSSAEKTPASIGSARPTNPIVINWRMRKLDGNVNLTVNPDGTWLFSGGFKDHKRDQDWDITFALKDRSGAIFLFHYEGDASQGVQFSKQGESPILKDDFKSFEHYTWAASAGFHLSAAGRKARWEAQQRKFERIQKEELEARKRHDEQLMAEKEREERAEAQAEAQWEENFARQHQGGGPSSGGGSNFGSDVVNTVGDVVGTVTGAVGDAVGAVGHTLKSAWDDIAGLF